MDAELVADQYTIDVPEIINPFIREFSNIKEYWQHCFIFGSTKLKLDDKKIRYVFNAQTGESLRIDNIFLKPANDNFDFFSNDKGNASPTNPISTQVFDPSGIGRTVGIVYTQNGTDANERFFELCSRYTKSDYRLEKLYNRATEINDDIDKYILLDSRFKIIRTYRYI